jgi:hypothetical protein
VFAWVKGASWRAQGGLVRKLRALEDQPGYPVRREASERGGGFLLLVDGLLSTRVF